MLMTMISDITACALIFGTLRLNRAPLAKPLDREHELFPSRVHAPKPVKAKLGGNHTKLSLPTSHHRMLPALSRRSMRIVYLS